MLEHLALAGPVTVDELSRHLDRSQSVVSDIVTHLEGAGLLERQDDPAGRRRRLVWLSSAGRESLERDRDVLSIKLLERAFGAMTLASAAPSSSRWRLYYTATTWPRHRTRRLRLIHNTPQGDQHRVHGDPSGLA